MLRSRSKKRDTSYSSVYSVIYNWEKKSFPRKNTKERQSVNLALKQRPPVYWMFYKFCSELRKRPSLFLLICFHYFVRYLYELESCIQNRSNSLLNLETGWLYISVCNVAMQCGTTSILPAKKQIPWLGNTFLRISLSYPSMDTI